MNPIEEQKEYDEFWKSLAKRAIETDNDFHKLSPENQQKIRKEIENLICAGGISEIMKQLEERNG